MTSKSNPARAAFVIANTKAKLLDQLREVLRVKHYSLRTEQAYVLWLRRFSKFHWDRSGGWKLPRELGATEVGAFLNHLAYGEHDAVYAHNQALNLIEFLCEFSVCRSSFGADGSSSISWVSPELQLTAGKEPFHLSRHSVQAMLNHETRARLLSGSACCNSALGSLRSRRGNESLNLLTSPPHNQVQSIL